MPTTSCNSNIVLHGLPTVAWAHTTVYTRFTRLRDGPLGK